MTNTIYFPFHASSPDQPPLPHLHTFVPQTKVQRYGKGRRGRRWQGDDPICCSFVGVYSDLMRNFELYGGMFLDWEG